MIVELKVENNQRGKRQPNIISSISQSGSSAPPPCVCAGLHLIKSFNLDHSDRAALFTTLHLGNATTCAAVPLPATCGHLDTEQTKSRLLASTQHPSLQSAMETGVIFCPKWHGAPWLFLLVILCYSPAAEAEITCRSCQPGNKWRVQEILLKFDTSESAAGLKGEVYGHGDGAGRSAATSAGSRRLRCAEGSAQCALERAVNKEPRLKGNTDKLHPDGQTGESELTRKMKVSGGQQKSSDRAGLTFASGSGKRTRRNSDGEEDRRLGPAQIQHPGEDISAATGRRATRSELRWSGDERRAAAPRQEELKLNSSTFALTGDSSHNQAMVHWSGQNSSVSPSLCPL